VPGGTAGHAAPTKLTLYAHVLAAERLPVSFKGFFFFFSLSLQTSGGLLPDFLLLLKRLKGVLNQAILANEDVEGFSIFSRVSCIISAAVGLPLAARRL
jgi:hypothetical protein